MRAADARLRGQAGQSPQRGVQCARFAVEHAATAAGEQRVAAEQRAAGQIGQVFARMAGRRNHFDRLAEQFKRIAVGEQMRRIADSVLKVNPATKIVAMGDFNDDPTDPSMLEGLNAKPKVKDLQPGDFFSPFHAVLRAGMGTLAYGDAWNLFDNIVVSENLVNAKPGELRLVRAPGSKYYGNVFKRNYMIQREGQFKGYPLRTYVGNNFQGGYSDHFPVYIYIGK